MSSFDLKNIGILKGTSVSSRDAPNQSHPVLDTVWLISLSPSLLSASVGLAVRFTIYFHGSCVFPHIKTVYVRPCHRVMDCIVLFSQEEKGGWWKEGGKERGKEWVSEGGSGVVRRGSEGHGSLAPAKKTVLNTCSCLQRPFNLLITCQSITRQPDQMSAAARTRTGRARARREGERGREGKRGTDCKSGGAKNVREVNGAAGWRSVE